MRYTKYHSKFTAKGVTTSEADLSCVEMSYATFEEGTIGRVFKRNQDNIQVLYGDQIVDGLFGIVRLRGFTVDYRSLLIVIDHPDCEDDNVEHHFLYEARDSRGLYIQEARQLFLKQLDVYTSSE